MIGLQAATTVYERARRAEFAAHTIGHPGFRQFSFALQNFIRDLGEEIEQDDWQAFVRRLKRYRFEQLAAPLGFGNPAAFSEQDWEKLNHIANRMLAVSPDFGARAREILNLLDRLRGENANPLLDKLAELAEETDSLRVVILESRLIKPAEEAFAARALCDKLSVISEAQLRGGQCFDEIACPGASRWYSEYVFSAPRAGKIHLLRFDWLRDKREVGSHFINPLKRGASGGTGRRLPESSGAPFPETTERESSENSLESGEIVPAINLNSIAASFAARGRGNPAAGEIVEETDARLFWLEGRRGVFLEEAAKVLVIDLEEETKVRKVEVTEIAPGMFVLLRDGRGGDLIIPFANRVMGKRAAQLRQFQKMWKLRLREAVQAEGLSRVVAKLEQLGAVRASETNLRNWMSQSNIETRDPRDFGALMKLIGMEADLDRCFRMVKEIRQAHKKAGMHIRRLLLEMVAETDLSVLEKHGEMTFELMQSGGRLVASRVVRRMDSAVQILTKQINYRFSLEDGGEDFI